MKIGDDDILGITAMLIEDRLYEDFLKGDKDLRKADIWLAVNDPEWLIPTNEIAGLLSFVDGFIEANREHVTDVLKKELSDGDPRAMNPPLQAVKDHLVAAIKVAGGMA